MTCVCMFVTLKAAGGGGRLGEGGEDLRIKPRLVCKRAFRARVWVRACTFRKI